MTPKFVRVAGLMIMVVIIKYIPFSHICQDVTVVAELALPEKWLD